MEFWLDLGKRSKTWRKPPPISRVLDRMRRENKNTNQIRRVIYDCIAPGFVDSLWLCAVFELPKQSNVAMFWVSASTKIPTHDNASSDVLQYFFWCFTQISDVRLYDFWRCTVFEAGKQDPTLRSSASEAPTSHGAREIFRLLNLLYQAVRYISIQIRRHGATV